MATTDKQIKEKMLRSLNASPHELATMVVKSHLENARHLQIRMVVWLNAERDPWDDGLELVEICGNLPADPGSDFRPVEFAPHGGWPRLKIILTSVQELVVDEKLVDDGEITGVQESFITKIENALRAHPQTALIFPPGVADPVAEFQKLIRVGA